MGTHPIFESDFDCLTEKMNKAKLALGPMARPSGFVGNAWKRTAQWNALALGSGCAFTAYWYVFEETVDFDEMLNFDRTAQFNRIRDRGFFHVGEEAVGAPGRVARPANWQVGYKQYAAQQAAEQEIIDAHIEEHGIKKTTHGWVSPFNSAYYK